MLKTDLQCATCGWTGTEVRLPSNMPVGLGVPEMDLTSMGTIERPSVEDL